jgi:hypothetical protein
LRHIPSEVIHEQGIRLPKQLQKRNRGCKRKVKDLKGETGHLPHKLVAIRCRQRRGTVRVGLHSLDYSSTSPLASAVLGIATLPSGPGSIGVVNDDMLRPGLGLVAAGKHGELPVGDWGCFTVEYVALNRLTLRTPTPGCGKGDGTDPLARAGSTGEVSQHQPDLLALPRSVFLRQLHAYYSVASV